MLQSACMIDVEKAGCQGLLRGSNSCALCIPVCKTKYFKYCYSFWVVKVGDDLSSVLV